MFPLGLGFDKASSWDSVTGAHIGRPEISGLRQIKSFREGSRFDVDASV